MTAAHCPGTASGLASSGASCEPAEDATAEDAVTPGEQTACSHPAKGLSPALLREDARHCRACSSLVFDDGHTEPVVITHMSRTQR